MTKGNKGFGALLTEGLDEEPAAETVPVGAGIMASRSQALARLATGKVVGDRTEFIDPVRCKPWRLHNRDLDHLNEESCRDLIDSFLAAKKQRLPAIVRRLRDDPDHDYEIVAGVRRWWVVQWLREHHHTEFEYLVTVQSLTDEEAFRVSDIENRARKDISDWERAQEYSRALVEFYDGSQTEMAKHINVSKSWLTRMLDVARLPEEVVSAFGDRHDITVRIARDLKPLVAEGRGLKAMTVEAARIADQRATSGSGPSGAEVAKRLIRSTEEPQPTRAKRSAPTEVRSAGDKPMLSVVRATGRGGGLTIKVLPRSGAKKAELLKALDAVLSEHGGF